MVVNNKEYALYRGDKFIEIGTLEELSKKLNVSRKKIFWFKTPSYKEMVGKVKKYHSRIILVCVTDFIDEAYEGEEIEMMDEWNQIYHDVFDDVNWDNCSRSTQNNLKELNRMYQEVKLENKLLKNEILRLFDRLCEKVNYPKKFDINYLESWLKDQKNNSYCQCWQNGVEEQKNANK